MSYIYALYFIEQKAVKIGKADDLLNRLSDLVATWGNIDPYRAKAWEIDEQLTSVVNSNYTTNTRNIENKCLKVMGQLNFSSPLYGNF